jgi:hypothetical protein
VTPHRPAGSDPHRDAPTDGRHRDAPAPAHTGHPGAHPSAPAVAGAHPDDGRAIIEVVFLAVLLLIPVVYILIALLRLQGATLAVSQAARDVGRLIETSGATGVSSQLMHEVAGQDLRDQGISTDQMVLRTTPAGADCTRSDSLEPSYQPGATYQLCVVAVVSLPGVPTILSGSKNTVTGIYTVHIGELREGP